MTVRDGFDRELGPGGLEARGYSTIVETRAASDGAGPFITGIGSPYGQATRIEGWYDEWDEIVASGAWKRTIGRPGADIVSCFNHDTDRLLGRTSAGTLTLTETDDGLRYKTYINPADPNAMSVWAQVERGDVTGASVWFRVLSEKWDEPDDENGYERPVRTILEAELFEVGPVVFPAFPQTTADTRVATMRHLGHTRAEVSVVDGALRAAGVTQCAARASLAARIFADTDPSSVEDQIRDLLSRDPGLKRNVCDTPPLDPAAVTPSEPAGPSLSHVLPDSRAARAAALHASVQDRFAAVLARKSRR